MIYALSDPKRIPPFKQTPYEELCLAGLEMRTVQANSLVAFDFYTKRVKENNIETRRQPLHSIRQ